MDWQKLIADLATEQADIELGGGKAAIERQHKKGRLTARERIELLLDSPSSWQEIGLWAGWEMYTQWGGAKSASVVCGLGEVSGRTR